MYYTTILFDLDGTITDSAPGIMRSVSYALEKMNFPPAPYETLRRFIGPPLMDSFTGLIGMTEEEASQAINYYRELYNAEAKFDAFVYDGIPELLKKLKEEGRLVILATSKPQHYAEQILAHFGLDQYFDLIAGPTIGTLKYEKADIIMDIFNRLEHVSGGNPPDKKNMVMIGDTRFDVEGARICGLDAIGVTYGFGSREELEKEGAIRIAESASGIYKAVTY